MEEQPASAAQQQQQQQEQHQQQQGQDNPCTSGRPAAYVIIHNIAKRHNIGTLLRSCSAFGVQEACLVGRADYNAFGAHGADSHVALRHFSSLEDCVAWCRGQGCRVLGVEIDDAALPVGAPDAFTGPSAFMLGNEGQGLSPKQLRLCDALVYIPQHGPGTASLNVTVAASIVLHRFASWAQYQERGRQGAKFTVAPRPQRTHARGVAPPAEARGGEVQRAGAGDRGACEEWLQRALAEAGGAEGLLERLATS